MGRFIIFTFLLLGWSFYELSGGAEFEPEVRTAKALPEDTTRAAPLMAQARIEPVVFTVAQRAEPAPEPAAEVVAAVVSPAPQSADVAAEPVRADVRAVAGNRVNMREGPGTAHPVIVTVAQGTRAEVLEVTADGWARIRLADSAETGWMAERLLTDS